MSSYKLNRDGLYAKYRVERVDGKPIGPCFVLEYHKDRWAAEALATYAQQCHSEAPELASSLKDVLAAVHPDVVVEFTPNPLHTADGLADAIIEKWGQSQQDEDGSQDFTIDSEQELLQYLRVVLGEAVDDHDFVGVAEHPDDDECTYRSDGTDATYCGRTDDQHY